MLYWQSEIIDNSWLALYIQIMLPVLERRYRPSQSEVLKAEIARVGTTKTDLHVILRHFREESLLYALNPYLTGKERESAQRKAYAIAEVAHAITHRSKIEDPTLTEVAYQAIWARAEIGNSTLEPLLSGLSFTQLYNARRVLYFVSNMIVQVLPQD